MHFRKKTIDDVCSSLQNNETFMKTDLISIAWGMADTNLAFCVTPKVGCTFWKSIFMFVNKDYKGNYTSPRHIPRMSIHYTNLKRTRVFRLRNPIHRMLLSSQYTFMFSRDPYSRLWSAYIDKIFLPDFWRTAARPIIRKRPNMTEDKIKCPHDISFREFIEFVVTTIPNGQSLNHHWAPLHILCGPCHIRYDFIGKLDTFSSDRDSILTEQGLGYFIPTSTFKESVIEEINVLVKYNFNLRDKLPEGCFQNFEIAQKLWAAFQFNGYIKTDSEFSFENSTPVNETILRARLTREVEKDPRTVMDWRKQRRDTMAHAYRQLPSFLLEGIRRTYELDFKLFGYEESPELIFGSRE